MPDWDAESETLRANAARVLSRLRDDAPARIEPSVELARAWHRDLMQDLTPPSPHYVGRFRGEPGLEATNVAVAGQLGVAPADVADA